MDRKMIDKIVWWIPFKNIRNFVREYIYLQINISDTLVYIEHKMQSLHMLELLRSEKYNDPKRLERYGFKVYSQNDEDGIINEIFNRIGTTNKFFVEFGVQDGLESNTHLLLFQGWEGVFIEGSKKYFDMIQKYFKLPIDRKQLTVLNRFITADNINKILSETKAAKINNIDLLSIDVDGNDYYIFNSIDVINPRVVIIEYNSKFPPPIEWVMPYNENHIWDGSDRFGASLESLNNLFNKKGYKLVATNITGTNAFFVKSELLLDNFANDNSPKYLYNDFRSGMMPFFNYRSEGFAEQSRIIYEYCYRDAA